MADDNTDIDLTSDAAVEAIRLAVEKETSELKLNRDTIKQEKTTLADKLKLFDGIDPEEAKKALEALIDKGDGGGDGGDNDSAMITLQKQLDDQRKDFDDKMSDMKKSSEKNEKLSNKYRDQLIRTTVGNEIRNTAIKAGVLPEALDDVVSKAAGVFSMGADNVVEARDSDGNLKKDTDDYLLTPERYLAELKNSHSYYWPSSVSGGLDGGAGGSSGSDLEAAINDAAASGDMTLYRELREKQSKLKAG